MKPTEVVVNETSFLVHPLDAFDALAVFGDLQKDILPAVGGLMSLLGDGSSEAQDEAALSDAITKLSERLDGRQLTSWANRLLTKENISVEINGNLMPLDAAAKSMAFKGFTDILELLFQVIRINFAGPLAGWLNRAGLGQKLHQLVQSDGTGQK